MKNRKRERVGPPEAAEVERYHQIRSRWILGGIGIGIVAGFVITALNVAWSGWHILPENLIWNLIWAPYLGAAMANGLCPAPRFQVWSLKHLRFRTRTLMILIAYLALLFGLGVLTGRIGSVSRVYHQKFVNSQYLAYVYRDVFQKLATDSKQRLESAAVLRTDKVSETLTQEQKDFLRSLDQKATPEYRKYRYGLIEESEESQGRMQEHNAVVVRGLAEYYEALAAKYDRARWRPWLPVEPDPPMPPTQ